MIVTAKDFVWEFEGNELEAYKKADDVWTIGRGHTGPEVHEGLVWTPSQSDDEALHDIGEARHLLFLYSPNIIHPGAIESLTDFIFNLGSANYRSSTLRLYVNGCNWPSVCTELLKWVHVKGVVSAGLLRRRQAEVANIT